MHYSFNLQIKLIIIELFKICSQSIDIFTSDNGGVCEVPQSADTEENITS
jgi:hypothetical protein